MPYQRPTPVAVSRTALAILAFALTANAPAGAGPKYAAPIVYRGDLAGSRPVVPTPSTPVYLSDDKAGARISYRYPGEGPAPELIGASAPAQLPPSPAIPVLVLPPPDDLITSAALPPVPAVSAQPETGQGPRYLTGAPMVAAPAPVSAQEEFIENGIATIYGNEFAGLPTANGEIFSQAGMSAAHPTLPLPSLVHITNSATGREVVVRVNDRGPFEEDASIQLSLAAAEALGMDPASRGQVALRYLGPAPVIAVPAPAVQPAASAPATLPAPASPARRDIVWPVAAEDTELLGGAVPAAAPPRRLMTLSTQPAPAAGSLFVQVGAFNDLGNAETMLRRVGHRLPVRIEPARVNGADFFRVRVGPFATEAEAEAARQRLSADGTASGRIVSAP